MILICCPFLSCKDALSEQNIYGEWKGSFQNNELFIRFDRGNSCELLFRDEFSGTTKIINGTFVLDFSKAPIPLSIENIPQRNNPLHSILEFIDADSIRIATFSMRRKLRPIFFDKSNSINLKKMKSNN